MVARISENVEATKEQTDAVDDHLSVTKSGRDRFENGTSVGVGDLLSFAGMHLEKTVIRAVPHC